jgi:hypothetical protein
MLNKRLIASIKKKLVKMALLSPKVSGKTTHSMVKKRMANEFVPVNLFLLTTKSTNNTLNKSVKSTKIDGTISMSIKA